MFATQYNNRGGFGRGYQGNNFRGNAARGRGGVRPGSGANYGNRTKYPVDKAAYREALGKMKEGQGPPPYMDCPLKCEHAVPYGRGDYCHNF